MLQCLHFFLTLHNGLLKFLQLLLFRQDFAIYCLAFTPRGGGKSVGSEVGPGRCGRGACGGGGVVATRRAEHGEVGLCAGQGVVDVLPAGVDKRANSMIGN